MKTTNYLNQKYSTATIAIHWISTIIILMLFPLDKYTKGIEDEEKLSYNSNPCFIRTSLININSNMNLVVFQKQKTSRYENEFYIYR